MFARGQAGRRRLKLLATAYQRLITARTARARHDPLMQTYGFERLPVFGLAVVLIAFLCAPSLGAVATLVQLGTFVAIGVIGWRQLLADPLASLALLLLPLFACASALWSPVPDISLRYGLQLVVTIVIGIAMGRVLTVQQLVLAVFLGTTIACLAGLGSGRTGVSEGGPVLIGLSGSKNQMSYITLFWIGSAVCVLASGAYRLPWRILAALTLAPAGFLLLQGESMTAVVSAVIMAGLLAVLALAAFVGRGGRLFALLAGVLLAVPTLVALPEIDRQADMLRTDVLHKDASLTGRTVLWDSADELIRQSPTIGHGYKAIWLGPAGKGLLARNNQRDGRAFHFHDTFRELMADLGMIGLALFLLPLGFAGARGAALLIGKVDTPRAFAAVTLFIILLRIRTELVVAPFMIDTVLLYAIVTALIATPFAWASPERSPAAPSRMHRQWRERSQGRSQQREPLIPHPSQ